MREIFYCIYKTSSIYVLLDVILTEAIKYDRVIIRNNVIKRIKNDDFFESEKQILDYYKFGKKNKIKTKFLFNFRNEIIDYCKKNKYLKRKIFGGLKFTKKFKRLISNNLAQESFDKNIIDYIDSRDRQYLIPIVKNIHSVEYPAFDLENFDTKGWFCKRYNEPNPDLIGANVAHL